MISKREMENGQRFLQKFIMKIIQMGWSSQDLKKFKWEIQTNCFWNAHAQNSFGGWPYNGCCLLGAKTENQTTLLQISLEIWYISVDYTQDREN